MAHEEKKDGKAEPIKATVLRGLHTKECIRAQIDALPVGEALLVDPRNALPEVPPGVSVGMALPVAVGEPCRQESTTRVGLHGQDFADGYDRIFGKKEESTSAEDLPMILPRKMGPNGRPSIN